MRRFVVVAALVVVAGLGLAAGAGAASVSQSATSGAGSEVSVQVTAGRGERNRVRVVRRAGRVVITDTGVRRLRGRRGPPLGSCGNRGRQTVVCDRRAPVFVALGDRGDWVAFDVPGRGDDRAPGNPAELARLPVGAEAEEGALVAETVVEGGTGDDVIVARRLET